MATKIWFKGPDGNGECCGCEGKTSPCDDCSCKFVIPFAPTDGSTTAFPTLAAAQSIFANNVSATEPCLAYWPPSIQGVPVSSLTAYVTTNGVEGANWKSTYPDAGTSSSGCVFKADIPDVHVTLGVGIPLTTVVPNIKGFFNVYDEDGVLVFSYASPTFDEVPGITVEATLPEIGKYTFYFLIQATVSDVSEPIPVNAFVQLSDSSLAIIPCSIQARYLNGSQQAVASCETYYDSLP